MVNGINIEDNESAQIKNTMGTGKNIIMVAAVKSKDDQKLISAGMDQRTISDNGDIVLSTELITPEEACFVQILYEMLVYMSRILKM